MHIASVRVRVVSVPDGGPSPVVPERQPKVRPIVTLRMRTNQDLEGIGIAFVPGGLTRPLAGIVEELAELTIGADPTRIEHMTANLRRHAATLASTGMFAVALSTIDCALWDIRGKEAGQPLWKLLGGLRQRVPAYASGQMHRDVSGSDLACVAERILARGFRYMKLHLALGDTVSPEQEVERARLVREIVGEHVKLGCDINERWSVGQAIAIGRRLEEVGLFWLEDPTRGDDYAGLARITRALSTPIMAGENNWGVTPFRLMLEAGSVDIAMIDIMHVGGISAWMKIAALADAFNVPVVSHIMPEFQAQLVAAVPNGLMAEHKEWTWNLFDGVPEIVGGDFVLSERPGHGLSFSPAFEHLT